MLFLQAIFLIYGWLPRFGVHGSGISYALGETLIHRVQLDQFGTYFLSWTPKDDEVVFEIQVKTKGYVGLGFSPDGGMEGADIYIGWVDQEGRVYLTDRHASGQRTPTVDPSQDHLLLGGYRNETHTVIRFSRPWVTCDTLNDNKLNEDTVRVIWAYDAFTPSPSQSTMKLHDHRGTKSLYLKEPKLTQSLDLNEQEYWDLRAPQVGLPYNISTLYWCKLYKMPDLKRKQHIIGYIPLIDKPGPRQYVHHMLLYECALENSAEYLEKWVEQKGAQCYSRNMPVSWNACGTPIVAWAIGSEGEMFPEHVGFPLGEEHGGSSYFLLEIHYDNPEHQKGVIDNSGIRLYLTDRPRQYDAAVLTLGHKVDPTMIIPPGRMWSSSGHCTSDCTKKVLPPEGIKIFSGILHAHLLGHSITLQHIRNGLELEPILSDNSYDFNYQQARIFPKEKTILPGDHLITTCMYDATKRHKATFGGFGTDDEMCLVFLSYYPKTNWSESYSRPDLALLFDVFGIQNLYENDVIMKAFSTENFKPSHIDSQLEDTMLTTMKQQVKPQSNVDHLKLVDFFRIVNISEPDNLRGKTFYDILHSEDTWQDPALISRLQEAVSRRPYELGCFFNGRQAVPGVPEKAKVPRYFPYNPEEKPCQSPRKLKTTDENIHRDDEKLQTTIQEESKLVHQKYTGQVNEKNSYSSQKSENSDDSKASCRDSASIIMISILCIGNGIYSSFQSRFE